jgi:hypothetical protein
MKNTTRMLSQRWHHSFDTSKAIKQLIDDLNELIDLPGRNPPAMAEYDNRRWIRQCQVLRAAQRVAEAIEHECVQIMEYNARQD